MKKGAIRAIVMAIITGVGGAYAVWSSHQTDKKLDELNKKLDERIDQ